ncbi:MAG: phage tail length tape measure family protein, partial [bacterium]
MGNIEDLKIILRAEVDKAISDLKRASREGKTAGKDWDNISKSFQANIKNSLSLKNAYAQLTMQIAGGLAVYQLAIKTISAIVTTTKESVTAFGKAREEHGRLEAQIKATGGAAGFTADELESMATSLQSATKISENEVRSAQSAMLKFTAITGDEFKRAIGLSLDLSKTMGTDAASAAQTLGKAIEDPVEGFGALRKAGVILSDSQEELAKKFVSTGEKGKAVELILNEIESRVGGVAKAIGKEDPAGLKRLGVATSEAKEHFGELISKGLSPVINKLAELLEKSNNAKDSFNNLQAALRGEGSVDTISSALTNEKKNLAALKASLGGADIWAAEQINRAIAQSELRIITLQETLKRMGQSSVLNGKPTNTTGLSESDKKAAEHIQAVNNEIEKNIQAIKLRAAALGKETSNQDIINQYVSSYVKLIQDSNGLITAANPAAIKLLSTIRELQGADAGESFADYYIEKAGTVEGARYQAAYDSYLKKKALEELAKTEA